MAAAHGSSETEEEDASSTYTGDRKRKSAVTFPENHTWPREIRKNPLKLSWGISS
jgi:hypothetical protein